jgi:hypothetical protein
MWDNTKDRKAQHKLQAGPHLTTSLNPFPIHPTPEPLVHNNLSDSLSKLLSISMLKHVKDKSNMVLILIWQTMYPEKWRRSLGKLITDCWVINGTVPH